jgi:GNAT superfamily N-acetyltransferase
MNSELNRSAHCYIGYIENNPVCFFAVLHFPHSNVKNMKKGHRLVVLPDYQGLGIGHQFSTAIAAQYKQQGFRFIITSSTKSLFTQRNADKRWAITRKGRTAKNTSGVLRGSTSESKMTYSYEYIG